MDMWDSDIPLATDAQAQPQQNSAAQESLGSKPGKNSLSDSDFDIADPMKPRRSKERELDLHSP